MEMKSGNPPPYGAPPAPPQFVPGPQPAHMVPVSTVTVVPSVVTAVPAMGTQPQPTTCRSCNAQVVTTVRHKSTTKTHLFAFLLCIFGCWPCVCIPYCMDSCRNIDHYCPNCESYLGTYVG